MDVNIGNLPAIRVAEPGKPKGKLGKNSSPAFITPQALFPTGFGALSWLRKQGINILVQDTNEFAGAITDPTPGFPQYKKGGSNAGQLSESLDIDWAKLAGVTGFATHAVTVGRYGTTANRMFGDWLNHSSEDYGGGGNVAVHLVYAYGEETLYHQRIAIAAGLMGEMGSFQSSPLFCNFMNNSMCGRPKAATDSPYASGYPASVWSGRIRVRPTQHTYAQVGAFAAEQGLYQNIQHRTGFKFNGATIKGWRLPLEIGWEPVIRGRLEGHYKIGGLWQHAPLPSNYYNKNGQSYALTGTKPRNVENTYAACGMTHAFPCEIGKFTGPLLTVVFLKVVLMIPLISLLPIRGLRQVLQIQTLSYWQKEKGFQIMRPGFREGHLF
ncbi:carbohydrate-selective porin [Lasius niger]|uniref:Carbohydrate-selective porin n=1 Tax=Lasius niger TaxID=67767 RepID=A0A0J7K564_LASNI|nr:carbohydrate-selective porin [Lasius niger]